MALSAASGAGRLLLLGANGAGQQQPGEEKRHGQGQSEPMVQQASTRGMGNEGHD